MPEHRSGTVPPSGNLRAGIIVEGGTGTVIKDDEVSAAGNGVSLRDGALDTILTGNMSDAMNGRYFASGPMRPESWSLVTPSTTRGSAC